LPSDPSRNTRRLARVAILALGLSAACELAKIEIPSSPSSVVIHGVLSGSAPYQTLLIERTLTGETAGPFVYVGDGPLGTIDPAEPIESDGGIPESNAVVTMTLPSGQILTAPELANALQSRRGLGVYRFSLAGSALVPGGVYKLRVSTLEGEVLTAQTIVPTVPPLVTAPMATFDRDSDTLAVAWTAKPGARNYYVTINSPYNSWWAFTDSTHLSLAGGLRNTTTDNLAHVFIPGFQQTVSVSAVDLNVYDYYRASNGGFTGAGIITHVTGGLGLFGSVITMSRNLLNVTAPTVRPVEGTWRLVPDPLVGLYGGQADVQSMTIYIESPAAREDESSIVSASYRTTSGAAGGAIGQFNANQIQVVFLGAQSVSDTLDEFNGLLRGDTLVGTFFFGAAGRYVRK
jgi:hypothetical protein